MANVNKALLAETTARARAAGYRDGIEAVANLMTRYLSKAPLKTDREAVAILTALPDAILALLPDRIAEGSAAIEPQEDR